MSNFKYEDVKQLDNKSGRMGNSFADNKFQGNSKLVSQHLKLKDILLQLARKIDQFKLQERDRKAKGKNYDPTETDPQVMKLRAELHQQQCRMLKIKNEKLKLRNSLDNKYDVLRIVEKENEIKDLENQLKKLQEENRSLEKIKQNQYKAIRETEDKDSASRIERMNEELREVRLNARKLAGEIYQREHKVRKLHKSKIKKEEKVKEIQTKIKEQSGLEKKGVRMEVSEQAIQKMKTEIAKFQEEKATAQREGQVKIRALEEKKRQVGLDVDAKKLILEKTEKDLKLNQIKHREIVRLIASQQTQHYSQHDEPAQESRVIGKAGRAPPTIPSARKFSGEKNLEKMKREGRNSRNSQGQHKSLDRGVENYQFESDEDIVADDC